MISEIAPILAQLRGTEEYDILVEMDAVYSRIEEKQREWFEKSKFTCPQGCGKCCEHFEPDLLESEALYMAAWLLCNQPEVAQKIAEEDHWYDVLRRMFHVEQSHQRCPFFRGIAPFMVAEHPFAVFSELRVSEISMAMKSGNPASFTRRKNLPPSRLCLVNPSSIGNILQKK